MMKAVSYNGWQPTAGCRIIDSSIPNKFVAVADEHGNRYSSVSLVPSEGRSIKMNPYARPLREATDEMIQSVQILYAPTLSTFVQKGIDVFTRKKVADTVPLFVLENQGIGKTPPSVFLNLKKFIDRYPGMRDTLFEHFSGVGIFQPGFVVDVETAKKIEGDLDEKQIGVMFKNPGPREACSATLVSVFGDDMLKKASRNVPIAQTARNPQGRWLQISSGCRVICRDARVGARVPAGMMGFVIESAHPIIVWDNGVLEKVTESLDKAIIMLRANVVGPSEDDVCYTFATIAEKLDAGRQVVAPRGFTNITRAVYDTLDPGMQARCWVRNSHSVLLNSSGDAIKPPKGLTDIPRHRGSPIIGDFLGQMALWDDTKTLKLSKDEAGVIRSVESVLGDSVDSAVVLALSDHFEFVVGYAPKVDVSMTVSESDFWQGWMTDKLKSVGSVIGGAVKGAVSGAASAVKSVLSRDPIPSASFDVTPTTIVDDNEHFDVAKERGLLSKIGDVARKVGEITGNVKDVVLGDRGADHVCPDVAIDPQNPETYRSLDKACCAKRHGLEYEGPTLRRSAKDSGCYHPVFDRVEPDGIYRGTTKLTRGGVDVPANVATPSGPIASGGSLTLQGMASVGLSLLTNESFSGVRSDGRLIPAPMPSFKKWIRAPKLMCLVRKQSVEIEKDLPSLASTIYSYSVIEDVHPFDWPLVIPYPDLEDRITELQYLAESRSDVFAFHESGFLFVMSNVNPSFLFNPDVFPKGSGKKLFIRTEFLGGKSTHAIKPLNFVRPMSQFCFFPATFVDAAVPSKKMPVHVAPPYTTAVAQVAQTPNVVAFDTRGRMFTVLPAINEWKVEAGSPVYSGLFVRRDTLLFTRADNEMISTLYPTDIMVGTPETGLARVQHVRCTPCLNYEMFGIEFMPLVQKSFRRLGLDSASQPNVAMALYAARDGAVVSETPNDDDVLRVGNGTEHLMEGLKGELDKIKSITANMEKLSQVPVEKISGEIASVRNKLQRIKDYIKAFSTAEENNIMRNAWRKKLASQRSALEELSKEVLALVDDLPEPVQDSLSGLDADNPILAGLGDTGAPAADKTREFAFMFPAVFISSLKRLGVPISHLSIRNDQRLAIMHRNPEIIFGSAADKIVVANIIRDGGACDMQGILFYVSHARRAVSFAITSHVVVSRESVDELVRRVLPGYLIQPAPLEIPKSCRSVRSADVAWPLFVFNAGIRFPGTQIPEENLTNSLFSQFVNLTISQITELQQIIRLANSQIHVVHETIYRCNRNPVSSECRALVFSPVDLETARGLFSVGNYHEVVSLLSTTKVSTQNIIPMLPMLKESALSSSLPSGILNQALAQRTQRDHWVNAPLYPLRA